MTLNISQPEFWETKYQAKESRWDLGIATPPLVTFFQSGQAPQSGKIIVLGCGQGHDAIFLAKRGFDVVGVDFAPAAIASARQLAQAEGVEINFVQKDIFELLPDFQASFDYLFEHTCFCAIPPEKRREYAQLSALLLKPEGLFYGLFFTHRRPGGPPFGSSATELKQIFSEEFTVLSLKPVNNSVPSRQGEEHWGIFQKKSKDIC